MAALTGLLGDYGSDDESGNDETGTKEVEMAEAGEAASRSASAMLSIVDGAPQISTEELLTETDMASLPQQPAEFDLPSEIAEPPDQICSAAVQAKIVKLLGIQSKGRFLNAELRSSRPYRNPDFLSHTVKHFELDPHGTCYPSDVFDPNALHKEDYYDRLAAEFNAWRERKSQQQQQKQQVDFVKGGTERAPSGPGGLQNKAQQTAAQVQAQAKAQAVLNAAQHKGGRNKWDTGPGR